MLLILISDLATLCYSTYTIPKFAKREGSFTNNMHSFLFLKNNENSVWQSAANAVAVCSRNMKNIDFLLKKCHSAIQYTSLVAIYEVLFFYISDVYTLDNKK